MNEKGNLKIKKKHSDTTGIEIDRMRRATLINL